VSTNERDDAEGVQCPLTRAELKEQARRWAWGEVYNRLLGTNSAGWRDKFKITMRLASLAEAFGEYVFAAEMEAAWREIRRELGPALWRLYEEGTRGT
jgi:hypothetical protein